MIVNSNDDKMKKKIFCIVAALLLAGSSNSMYAQKRALTLTDALAMARQGNKALQIQVLEEAYSREMTRETKNGLLPGISAHGAYSYYFDRQTIFLPGSFAGTNRPVQDIAVGGRNAFNAFVSLHQPVLALDIRRQAKAVIINEKIQSEKTDDLKSRVALQVATRYLDILMMDRQLDLLQQSLRRNLKALQDSRSLLIQGRGLKSDTLRSFVAVENLKSSVSYLKNRIDVSGMELKRLIGLSEPVEVELTDQLDFDDATVHSGFYKTDEALQIAEQNRRDLKIQKLTIDLQQKKIKATQAQLLPRLSLVGQYQLQAQSDDMSFDRYAWPRTSFLGLQLTVPVFNGNRTRSQINQVKIKTQQEEIRLNDLKDEVRTEVAATISRLKVAVMQMDIQKTTVESAELNYRMMEDRFQNGLGSRLELTDAELTLTQAKINCLQSVYNTRLLRLSLQYALGQLSL
jgi:outer membrane protein